MAGASPSDFLFSYPEHSLVGVLPLWKNAVYHFIWATILSVYKKMSFSLFKMLPTNSSFTNHMYSIYIYLYKQDLTENNLQGLICHKTQPTNLTECDI